MTGFGEAEARHAPLRIKVVAVYPNVFAKLYPGFRALSELHDLDELANGVMLTLHERQPDDANVTWVLAIINADYHRPDGPAHSVHPIQ